MNAGWIRTIALSVGLLTVMTACQPAPYRQGYSQPVRYAETYDPCRTDGRCGHLQRSYDADDSARRGTVWCGFPYSTFSHPARACVPVITAIDPTLCPRVPSLHVKRGIEIMLLGLVPMSEAIGGSNAVRFREGIAAVDMSRPSAFRCL